MCLCNIQRNSGLVHFKELVNFMDFIAIDALLSIQQSRPLINCKGTMTFGLRSRLAKGAKKLFRLHIFAQGGKNIESEKFAPQKPLI